jgi:hypothetical protein
MFKTGVYTHRADINFLVQTFATIIIQMLFGEEVAVITCRAHVQSGMGLQPLQSAFIPNFPIPDTVMSTGGLSPQSIVIPSLLGTK